MNILRIILSVPKTVYFNLRHLPLVQAVKLPVWVAYDTEVCIQGKIVLEACARLAMVRIGFLQPWACSKEITRLVVQVSGKLVLRGSAHIGHGSRIIVRRNAELVLGDNFAISGNTTINSYRQIVFGRDIQFSWDCLVMDSDTHTIMSEDGSVANHDRGITFGDEIWVGCRSTILKGADVPSNSVVGACSLVTGGCLSESTIIAGSPARSVKKISGWRL